MPVLVDDLIDAITGTKYSGIEDRLLQKPFDDLEDFFWNDDQEWMDKAFDLKGNKLLKAPGFEAGQKLVSQNPELAKTEGYQQGYGARQWTNQYENGRIPLKAMTEIAPGHFLRPDVARAAKAMERAARKDGINLSYTDTYRTYDSQVRLAAQKGLYSQGGLAAEPGTSKHGWGTAIDYGENPGEREWLARKAHKFGFSSIPREPWHWEYEGGFAAKPKGKKPKQKRPQPRPRTGPGATAGTRGELAEGAQFSSITSLPDAMAAVLSDRPTRRPKPRETKRNDQFATGKGNVWQQLKAGFRAAGRKDLAKMVDSEDFRTWINQESGGNPRAVSPANNQGKPNGGVFQFWAGHQWAQPYFRNGQFRMSAYQQAIAAVTHFNLTPARIRGFAAAIRAGSYKGWG